jgi:hypothetical protein
MKNSIKTGALLVAIMGANFAVRAQTSTTTASNGIIYSVGAESGIALGNFKDVYNWNLGGSIQADIPVARQFFFTINAGYQNYFGKNNIPGTTFSAEDLHAIPVKAGLKFFPVSDFYIEGEAGAAFVLNKSDVGYSKTAAFIWAPGIGVQLPLNNRSYIDAGVRYEASTKYVSGADNSRTNIVGLRVAYAFATK